MDMSSWLMLSLHTITFIRDYEKLKQHESQEEIYSLLGRWLFNKGCIFSIILFRIYIFFFIVFCSFFRNYSLTY